MLNDQELENVVGGITQNDAMAAAFKHAGIPNGAAMMKKCELDYEWGKQVYEIEFYYNGMEYEYKIELDYEWGKQVYEIEFYYNGMEYEYKIDTATGSILKAKKEWDD